VGPVSDAKGTAMPQQDQPGIRKGLLAGAVALALTGTGAALAWSADSPSPSPSQSAPPQSGPSKSAPGQENKPAKPEKAQRSQFQHSEGVVKDPDGTFKTILEQRGTVESVSASAITVKSEDGFSQSYAVNGDTKVTRLPAPAAGSGTTSPGATGDDGKRLRPADGTIADIATGDTVRIAGAKDGDKATAKRIVKGAGDGPGLGLGRGLGHGPGLGHKMGRGHGQDDQDS
jgi:glucose/arabinose dehydrogenase